MKTHSWGFVLTVGLKSEATVSWHLKSGIFESDLVGPKSIVTETREFEASFNCVCACVCVWYTGPVNSLLALVSFRSFLTLLC